MVNDGQESKAMGEQALPEFKQRVTLAELREGDFVYDLEELRITGPRGGRQRVYGMRIASELVCFEALTGECLFANGSHVRFIYKSQTAVIKRRG